MKTPLKVGDRVRVYGPIRYRYEIKGKESYAYSSTTFVIKEDLETELQLEPEKWDAAALQPEYFAHHKQCRRLAKESRIRMYGKFRVFTDIEKHAPDTPYVVFCPQTFEGKLGIKYEFIEVRKPKGEK
jgi:hypothetical protein